LKEAIKKDFWAELVYFKEWYTTSKYKQLTEHWYAHAIWGWISDEYLYDFKKDWDIDIKNYTFKEKIKYYHLFMNLPEEEAKIRSGNIVENYNIRLWIRNIYTNLFIKDFTSKWVFFWYWYFFVERDLVNTIKFDTEKGSKVIWEYRKLAWKSVINDPDKFGKKFWIKDPDEFIAILELIVDRRSKKKN